MNALRAKGVGSLLSLLVALCGWPLSVAAQPAEGSPASPGAVPGSPAVGDEPDTAAEAVPEAAPAAGTEPVTEAEPGAGTEAAARSASPSYVLERIDIRGNTTSASAIRHFVPIEPGEPFEVDDPSIERIRFRLMGTGWFEDVKLGP